MSGYPTDEELELFIKHMERQELYAPKHMKEQILSQAFPKQTVEIFPKSGRKGKAVQLLAYRLKIVAGMAAAIFMLILLPSFSMNSRYETRDESGEWEKEMETLPGEEQSENDMNNELNEGARQVNQKLNDWFRQIGKLFEIENGGNLYEN